MKEIMYKNFDEYYVDLSLKPRVYAIGDIKACSADNIPYLLISNFDAKLISYSEDMLEIITNIYSLLINNNMDIKDFDEIKYKCEKLLNEIIYT